MDVRDAATFLPLVPDPDGQRVALFDLDRTLIPGSSLVPFGRELLGLGLVSKRLLARHLATATRFRRGGLADDGVDRIRTDLLAVLAGRDHEPLRGVADKVGAALADSMYRSARHILDLHLAAGDFCVILTAAPQELAESLVAQVGAHRAVGTRLEVIDGRFTGRLTGAFCHGPGKLSRLAEDVGQVNWLRAAAYGDSASDLAVLERVADPVAVNPDRQLRAAAERAGWPVLTFV